MYWNWETAADPALSCFSWLDSLISSPTMLNLPEQPYFTNESNYTNVPFQYSKSVLCFSLYLFAKSSVGIFPSFSLWNLTIHPHSIWLCSSTDKPSMLTSGWLSPIGLQCNVLTLRHLLDILLWHFTWVMLKQLYCTLDYNTLILEWILNIQYPHFSQL